ncbi:MAG TPA: radical SAM protein [bacterium]|nr:radical SAM protein [bacterium]
MQIFGPIPSRRLGWSLGVNTLPEKICSYSCAYCQVGLTQHFDTTRRDYADPQELAALVAEKIAAVKQKGGTVEVISFVPDGEPTLDARLGDEIAAVRSMGKVAVITNGSLMDRADVRRDLLQADIVSIKIDTLDQPAWRKVDCPADGVALPALLDGIRTFAKEFKGTLLTETMLVGKVNDDAARLTATAKFIADLKPKKSYILVPTRPPARLDITLPTPETLAAAWQIFTAALPPDTAEMLTGHEGNAFSSTGDARADILAITAVHPLRIENIESILHAAGASWDIVESLKNEGLVSEVTFGTDRFIVRALHTFTKG